MADKAEKKNEAAEAAEPKKAAAKKPAADKAAPKAKADKAPAKKADAKKADTKKTDAATPRPGVLKVHHLRPELLAVIVRAVVGLEPAVVVAAVQRDQPASAEAQLVLHIDAELLLREVLAEIRHALGKRRAIDRVGDADRGGAARGLGVVDVEVLVVDTEEQRMLQRAGVDLAVDAVVDREGPDPRALLEADAVELVVRRDRLEAVAEGRVRAVIAEAIGPELRTRHHAVAQVLREVPVVGELVLELVAQ